MNKEQAQKLREPFDSSLIATLPYGDQLQYVGHAEVTDRLLSIDPEWTWEPVAFDAQGLPLFDADGGLWIRLTVCGVTRYGYGEPQAQSGKGKVYDRRKAAISNAIRVAAMRFGVALDLWYKDIPQLEPEVIEEPKPVADAAQFDRWTAEIAAAESLEDLMNVGKDVGSYAMSDESKHALLNVWQARKAELS